VVKNIQWSF